MRYLQFFFNVSYAGLGTLPGGPQVKSSEKSSAPLHYQSDGIAGRAAGDMVGDYQGSHASSQASCLWPTTHEPAVATFMYRHGPEPLCPVSNCEGCRQCITGRSIPTSLITAAVKACSLQVDARVGPMASQISSMNRNFCQILSS